METKPTDMTWGLPYTIVRIPPVIHLFSAMKKGVFSLQLSRTSRKEVFHRSRPGSLNNQYNRPVIKVPILAGSNTARSSREEKGSVWVGSITHRIHGTGIYVSPVTLISMVKCRYTYHTWILWVCKIPHTNGTYSPKS